MKEDFLHFIWQHRLYDASQLHTSDGAKIVVHQPGVINRSSGPDFKEVRIEVNGTLWVGAVEIHLSSSHWFAHKHQEDPAYDNVILHVVYEHDREVSTTRGGYIPTLQLRGRIKRSYLDRYAGLLQSKRDLPCKDILPTVGEYHWKAWLDRVLVQRLERKTQEVELLLSNSQGDWIQVYYSMLAGYLGGNWNKQPMFELARRVSYRTLMHYQDDHFSREAILFGVSNLALPRFLDRTWKPRGRELQHKHQIDACTLEWKTGRIRPGNAPFRRIAQLSGILPSVDEGFRQLISNGQFDWASQPLFYSKQWMDAPEAVPKLATVNSLSLSRGMSDLLAINVHAPLIHHYGRITGDFSLCERAVEGLHGLKPESNRLTRNWGQWGRKAHSAGESQALLELTNQYCNPKKCVLCNVGKTLISRQ